MASLVRALVRRQATCIGAMPTRWSNRRASAKSCGWPCLGLLAALLALASGPCPLRADEADDAMAQGNNAFRDDKYDQAIAQYTEAIRLNPNDGLSYATRGLTYAKKGDLDRAIADFTVFIRLNPDFIDGYVDRAQGYLLKGAYDQAIADCDAALRVNPDAARPYAERGEAYKKKGNPKKALASFNAAIDHQPNAAGYYNNVAWILATCATDSIRNGPKAVKYAEKACELTQWRASTAIDTLAAAYAEAGKFDDAINWEKRYLQFGLNKAHADSGNQRLSLYEQKKPYHEAKPAG